MVNQLPQGWKEEELGNLVDIFDNLRKPVSSTERLVRIKNKDKSELYPYYGATGLVDYIDGYIFDGEYLLLGEDGCPFLEPLKDKAYIISGKTWVNNHAHVLRAKESKTSNKFLLYYLNKFDYNGIVSGATRLKLNQNSMKKIPVYYPIDKSEQKYIVDTLDAVAEMIKLRKETIDLTKKLIPAIFQEMFGDPITNPKGWEMQAIKENKNVVSTGRTPPTKYNNMFGGDIPFITPGDLDNDQIVSERTLTEEGAKYSRLVRAGATLVCCIGNIGKTNITSQISAFNQQINAIEWNNKYYNDIFGVYLLKLLKPIFSSFGGAVVPILNKSSFESIRIIRPPLSLQDEFAKKVEQINKYIVAQQEELEHFETLFQSLLQEAFTGVLTWKYPREESND